jgi:hypothetical protein
MGIGRRWRASWQKIPVVYDLQIPVRHINKTGALGPQPVLESVQV